MLSFAHLEIKNTKIKAIILIQSQVFTFTLISLHIPFTQSSGTKTDSHVSQVFWDGDGDLVESVSSGRTVRVERPDPLRRDNLVVCGVTCCIFNYVKLKRTRNIFNNKY